MAKKKPPQRPNKKKRLKAQTVTIAKMVASGMTQTAVAAEVGISQSNVSRAVGVVNGLLTNLDDVAEARQQSLLELHEHRCRLLALAGIRDRLDPNARTPPPKPQPTADRNVTADQWDDYKKACLDTGFDENGFPLTCSEPAQQVAACRVLVQIEARRARLMGLDAPKMVASVTAKHVRNMDSTELIEEMREMGLEPPPGLLEALRAGQNPHPLVSTEAQERGLRPLTGGH